MNNTPNPMLDILMPGADTKAAQIHLHNFCDTFLNGDPTDAAYELMRNLTLLANRDQKVRRSNVVTSIIEHLPRRLDDE